MSRCSASADGGARSIRTPISACKFAFHPIAALTVAPLSNPRIARLTQLAAQISSRARAGAAGASSHLHDPVCGMLVTAAAAMNRADHGGEIYYFCCGGCKAQFMAEPARYRYRNR